MLVLLLDFLDQLFEVSVLFSDLSYWTLIVKFASILVIVVLGLYLRVSLMERELTVIEARNWRSNDHVLNGSSICHINFADLNLLLILLLFNFILFLSRI